MTRYGLDISKWQHDTPIDYHATANFLKWISESTEVYVILNALEPAHVLDVAGFQAEGVLVADYWFANPGLIAADDERDFRLHALVKPGALDLEVTGGRSWADLKAWADAWLSFPAERTTMFYSNLNYLTNMGGPPPFHGVWFAGNIWPANEPWVASIVMWQYEQIVVPGISGVVDINRWVGSDQQFYDYFGITPPAPPPPPPPPAVYRQPVRKRTWWRWW